MPLLWLSLAFLSGILTAGWNGPGFSASAWVYWAGAAGSTLPLGLFLRWISPAGAAHLASLAHRHPRLKFAPLLLLTLFALGGLRYCLAHLPLTPSDLAWYNGKGEFHLLAWVCADPGRRDGATLLRVQVTGIEIDGAWQPVRGLAQVMLPPGAGWAYGDRLTLTGKPAVPPEGEDFSYREFLAAQGIYAYLAYPRAAALEGWAGSRLLHQIYRLRAAGLKILERLYPPPEAQLLQGILLGVDERIPADVTRAFQATGIAHVIAISGFNMSVLSALFMGLLNRFLARWWAALSAALALSVYAVLAGGGASVIRAAIMCALALAAVQLGRGSSGLNGLVLAAGIMCLFDPNLPWDVGFQLSFAATAGLILYAGPLQAWFRQRIAARLPGAWGERIAGPVGEYLLCTLAAQATTLAVIVWHFRRISLSSLLANPLVLPAQPPLMVLGGLSLLAGLVWEPLGRFLAGAGWLFAAWTVGVARALSGLAGGEITLGPTGAAVVLAGTAALLLGLALREKLRPFAIGAALVLLPLMGLAAFTARSAVAGGDGLFHLVVYDLPGGPAVLLREPRGAALFVGGADSGSGLEEALGRWLPPGARLAGLVVPAGLSQKGLPAAVERFHPAQAYLCPDAQGLKAGLEAALRENGIPTQLIAPGRTLEWGEARVQAIAPAAGDCALLTGFRNLRVLLPNGSVPVVGTMESSNEYATMLEQVPDEAGAGLVVVVGNAPRWIAPPPGGWVHVRTDGEKMWVEVGR
jgi:competence protein ComEC